jgi:hypothetical protein
VEDDRETVVVKYVLPEDTGGVWTFDIRFSVKGKNAQVLAAAMTLVDIGKSVNVELTTFLGGMKNERS